ncbi:hypothetical protein F511_29862 [Dorcoceras hygrometricum]|uniref:Uncharacterized protein n=1 Tax=Dorcoceras hygrometricum TaxID=472368 RepID=A0A2Z7DAA8_9LAMI|nr:hypothetical protein F511_29862 [Dorcoceras hygrometricum]
MGVSVSSHTTHTLIVATLATTHSYDQQPQELLATTTAHQPASCVCLTHFFTVSARKATDTSLTSQCERQLDLFNVSVQRLQLLDVCDSLTNLYNSSLETHATSNHIAPAGRGIWSNKSRAAMAHVVERNDSLEDFDYSESRYNPLLRPTVARTPSNHHCTLARKLRVSNSLLYSLSEKGYRHFFNVSV